MGDESRDWFDIVADELGHCFYSVAYRSRHCSGGVVDALSDYEGRGQSGDKSIEKL